MKKRILFLVLVLLLLVSCGEATPVVVEKRVVETREVLVTAVPEPTLAPHEPEVSFDEALACVKEFLPAQAYMTNDYLPGAGSWSPLDCGGEMASIKVGMPWVLNDEESPWYNAVELGFYEDLCLEVELLPGGPGKNHLQTLGGGAVDIAVTAGGQAIPAAVASVTPIDLVAVGTFLKGMPYCFITVDEALLGKKLSPYDLVGRTLAIQSGSEVYAHMMLDSQRIPREEVKLIEAGWTPDVLLVGQADFYAGWVVNQPRLIEEQGFGWNAIYYKDWVFNEYSDVMAVRRETLETPEGQEMVRRFLAATHQGLLYLLEDPESAAEIAVKYGVEAELTKEQALWRFEQQRALIYGQDGLGLMAMDPEKWDEEVAILVQYGMIELPCW